jgi:hypothetical protein
MRPNGSSFFSFLVLTATSSIIGLGLVACGGSTTSPSGSASLSGSVGGTSFTVASSLAEIQAASSSESCGFGSDGGSTGCTSTSSGQVVAVLLTNRGDATCSYGQSHQGSQTEFSNFDELIVGVVSPNGTVTKGTYDVAPPTNSSPQGGFAIFQTTTSTCGMGQEATAESGTVTFTDLTDTSVTGTYDVSFGNAGSFSGSFDVAVCTLPDAGGAPSGVDAGTVCM